MKTLALKLLPPLLCLSLLSACGGFRQITKIENGGQSFLELGNVTGTNIEANKLAPRDTVVIANDSGTAISSGTNIVNLRIFEPLSTPISFGIPNFDARFGWMVKKPDDSKSAENKKPEEKFLLHTRKLVSIKDGPWVLGGQHYLNEKEIEIGHIPLRYKITAVNMGTKKFTGKLAIYDKLPTNIAFEKHLFAHGVQDASVAKALLSLVPIVNFFANEMDQFQPHPDAKISMSHTLDNEQGLLKYDTDTIQLDPGQGVEVQFSVRALLPRDEALLKARMQPIQNNQ